MKIAIFTGNSIRHKFFANSISKIVDETLVISETRKNDAVMFENNNQISDIERHFLERFKTEKEYFAGNDFFLGKTIPVEYKEVNLKYIIDVIKDFSPDIMLVFGSSIIHDELISLAKKNRFLNLHLGLSPYYRGSGTNFWPFINEEIQYLGSTILHLDRGIDTGDIVTHVRPKIIENDNVHTIGCKIIQESVETFKKIFELISNGKELNRVKQWEPSIKRYYKNADFTEEILEKYRDNLRNGVVTKFLESKRKNIKLID
jgi:methionyl-tRNA formyltransferase